jgi:hypothetical protein
MRPERLDDAMTTLAQLDVAVADVETIIERREEILTAIRDHAGRIAYNLARVEGGDYGRRSFSTDGGEWTLKHEAGELEFLKYDPGGEEIYVVSTQHPAEPQALSRALEDYAAFVESYNAHVRAIDGILDDIEPSLPAVESTEALVAERDRIVASIEDCCDRIAGELYRYEGTDYGTFSARVGSTRWELKREQDSVSYLRAGGSDGVYVLSQYGPASADDVREYAPRFDAFLDAYNEHVEALEADLRTVDR